MPDHCEHTVWECTPSKTPGYSWHTCIDCKNVGWDPFVSDRQKRRDPNECCGVCGFRGLGAIIADAHNVRRVTLDELSASPMPKGPQVGGDHYERMKIQPFDVWDAMTDGDPSPYVYQAIKYLMRAGEKGSESEDLRKAEHYCREAAERAERNENK
jgi:hypothetical protein